MAHAAAILEADAHHCVKPEPEHEGFPRSKGEMSGVQIRQARPARPVAGARREGLELMSRKFLIARYQILGLTFLDAVTDFADSSRPIGKRIAKVVNTPEGSMLQLMSEHIYVSGAVVRAASK
jgi:hypothetical protein